MISHYQKTALKNQRKHEAKKAAKAGTWDTYLFKPKQTKPVKLALCLKV